MPFEFKRFFKRKEKNVVENDYSAAYKRAASMDWSTYLEHLQFNGDAQRGSTLIQAFAKGGQDVLNAFSKRGRLPADYIPTPFIPLKGHGTTGHVSEVEETAQGKRITKSIIRLDIEMIEELLRVGESQILQSVDANNPEFILNIGTAESIMYLAGMEEVAHDVFSASRDYEDSDLENDSRYKTHSIIHDSTDVEYHGLGWSIRTLLDAANNQDLQQQKINTKNIELLKARLIRAANFRKNAKES